MADYCLLIAKAVSDLEKNTDQARRVLYHRARAELSALLRRYDLSEPDIIRERLALEQAIARVEIKTARSHHDDAQDEVPDKDWFLSLNGERDGPYTFAALIEAASRQVINGDTMLWRQGWQNWHPARHIPGIIENTEAGDGSEYLNEVGVIEGGDNPTTVPKFEVDDEELQRREEEEAERKAQEEERRQRDDEAKRRAEEERKHTALRDAIAAFSDLTKF